MSYAPRPVLRSTCKRRRLATAADSLLRQPRPVPPSLPLHAAEPPSFELEQRSLRLHAPSHGFSGARFPYIWLRDACTAAHSVDPSSKQKLFRTTDVPADVRPARCTLVDDGAGEPALQIEWNKPLRGQPDAPRQSRYTLSYLRRHLNASSLAAWHCDSSALPIAWDRAMFEKRNLWFSYDQLHRPEVLGAAIEQLLIYGLVFFRNVPFDRKDDMSCELPKLAEMLGEIRRTWYGDKVWDVRSVPDAKNIAYTNLDLGLHMDLLHFDNPPRYQLLHYLHGHSSLHGGESYFVDAYRAADDLFESDVEAWRTLVETPFAFEYRNGGHWRHAERPTIELSPTGYHAINYSPPFQAPLLLDDADGIARLHSALTAFADRVEAPEQRFTVQLQPGDVACFDNQRVLHARTAFTWDDDAVRASGEAGRHLKGCYVEGDSVRDRRRVMLRETAGR